MAFRFIDANEMNYFKIVKLSKNSRRMTCKFREKERIRKNPPQKFISFFNRKSEWLPVLF